ncbi:MAG: DUF3307 domain-containing protein [Chitinophagaceae bacterium]
MTTAAVWLIKLLLSHLLTDFILQPKSWVDDRNAKHFASLKLYLHGGITGLLAWLLMGTEYWIPALVILISHTVIDGWKSYRKNTVVYFLVDQLLHLLVIIACWCILFIKWTNVQSGWHHLNTQPATWKLITAFVFLTTPAGILIGQLTKQWRDKIDGAESLANAGKWIGIAERIIIFIFVLYSQFSAIGLLVAAKGIIRFNEKDRQEIKTEYLVVGTLLSIGLAVITGLLARL